MEHKDIADAYLHETKGAATASAGQILIATGVGTATFQTSPYSKVVVGWYNYSDTATASTPIALTTAGTYYNLTNNGLGTDTNTGYGISGVPSVWNTATNRFDFSSLALGDVVNFRVDLQVVTTTANTAVDVVLDLAGDTGSPVSIPLSVGNNIKTATTTQLSFNIPFALYNATVKNNAAKLKMRADTTGATVVVKNFYVEVVKRG